MRETTHGDRGSDANALLGVTLLYRPRPEARPRPALDARTVRQVCAGFGQFAYTRALERDAGLDYSLALHQAMTWDVRQ